MVDDDTHAKSICVDLYGECACVIARRDACEAMIGLVEGFRTVADQMNRINNVESEEG